MKSAVFAWFPLLGALAAGCHPAPAASPSNVSTTVPDSSGKEQGLEPAREAPPESGPVRETAFPKIEHHDLVNGLALDVVPVKTLPIVQLRVLVKTGTASDGDNTGVAQLTAKMLKDGGAGRYPSREVLSKVETMGADLGVEVGPDSTVLSLSVAKRHFEDALDLLGAIVREPRWDDQEFSKLKKRQVQKVADKAKSSGTWAATMLLWRELYRTPTGVHPYAPYDAVPSELGKITNAVCREFYKKNFSPKNTTVVIGGDVELDQAKASVERAFGAWKGGEIAAPSFAEATPPERLKILLADRPKSAQSDIYVGTLGPSRSDDTWTAVKVGNQILGGGVSGRLFLDVREKRSLAYTTRSSVGELSHGPVPITAYAGTQTAKTGIAVQALLENLKRIGAEAAADDELNTARRYLSDVLALRMETIGSVSDMVVSLRVLGLPDDYYDAYRRDVRAVTAADAQKAMGEHLREGHAVIAVTGDAERIGAALSHFGEVIVVNPEKEFERVRTIPANPSAPLELERESGQ